MAFDWIGFLNRYNITWVDKGRNVSSGNIAVQCPMCGHEDPSQHMTISLDGGGWRCWRNYEHRGKNPRRLVQALIHCSADEASAIVGSRAPELRSDEAFVADTLAALNGPPAVQTVSTKLKYLREMRPLSAAGAGLYAYRYLQARGYTRLEIDKAAATYHLMFAGRGPFRYRIIFPITLNGKLVNWTGRTIANAVPRYRTLSTDPERSNKAGLPLAVKPVSELLWNYDLLIKVGGRILVITEGPFDALRVDMLGVRYGIRATCIFGLGNGQGEQLSLLDNLAQCFDEVIVLLDSTAALEAISLQARIAHLKPRFLTVPKGVDDPGELTISTFKQTFALRL
jgi:hypothetical protein